MTQVDLVPLLVVGAVLVGVFGLLIGSFLNVVVYRVPNGLSVVNPPSACPGCGADIKPYDNVPVLSWLVLGGRCRACREPISVRYPLVELAGGVAFIGVAGWWTSVTGLTETVSGIVASGLGLVAFLYLAAVSLALGLIDLDLHRLPDRIVLPAYVVLTVLLGASALLDGRPEALGRAVIGAAVLAVFYLILATVKPGAMGLGDVKLAGVLGLALAWLGWPQLIVGAFGAFLTGGLFAVSLLVTGRARRGSGIPFGPWMLLGAWIGAVAGEPVATVYLSSLGLA
ncbi:prepilin peptidase [Labedella phragmitis]|uniref:Prepilin peptidase n=1 Tax=Labedella phragmitis TaxID=2498849 RepID=A0A3S4BH70_9MICO|nr:A24 family peptidase [Labedella phragmitis]RWZ50032.1 prepilin peptidase [Labedella phragmitis]